MYANRFSSKSSGQGQYKFQQLIFNHFFITGLSTLILSPVETGITIYRVQKILIHLTALGIALLYIC